MARRNRDPFMPDVLTVGFTVERPVDQAQIDVAAAHARQHVISMGRVPAPEPALITRGHEYDTWDYQGLHHVQQIWVSIAHWAVGQSPAPVVDERQGHRD